MTIRKVLPEDLLQDIRRGDHIIFGINSEGVHPDGSEHYGLVQQIYHDFCHEYKEVGKNDIGTVISHEVAEYGCWFHAIVTHSITAGWPTEDDDYPHTFIAIEEALNEINEKWGDEIPLAAKCVWLGRGKQRTLGGAKGNIIKTMRAMANSELPLDLYVPDSDWF